MTGRSHCGSAPPYSRKLLAHEHLIGHGLLGSCRRSELSGEKISAATRSVYLILSNTPRVEAVNYDIHAPLPSGTYKRAPHEHTLSPVAASSTVALPLSTADVMPQKRGYGAVLRSGFSQELHVLLHPQTDLERMVNAHNTTSTQQALPWATGAYCDMAWKTHIHVTANILRSSSVGKSPPVRAFWAQTRLPYRTEEVWLAGNRTVIPQQFVYHAREKNKTYFLSRERALMPPLSKRPWFVHSLLPC